MIDLFTSVEKKDLEITKALDKNRVNGSNVGYATVDGFNIEYRTVLVTPELAEALLVYNTKNRSLRKEKVDLFNKEMIADNWIFNSFPICFSDEGIMINGQTRLNSVIKSGIEQVFLFSTGMNPESFHTMDNNAIRTIRDTAHCAGIKHDSVVGSAARAVYGLENQRWSRNKGAARTLTNPEFIKVYNLDKENYDISTTFAVVLHKKTKNSCLTSTDLAAYHYKFSQSDKELAKEFLVKLFTGEMLSSKSPIFMLREILMRVKSDKNFTLTGEDKTKLIIYTWNTVKVGTKIKKLIVPEDFDGVIL